MTIWQKIQASFNRLLLSSTEQPKLWSISLFFSLFVFILFNNTLKLPFIADDYIYLYNIITTPFWSMWGKAQNMLFFRPMVDISFWLDFKLWGFQSWGFHLTNLFIHLANTILAVYLSRKFFIRAGIGNTKALYFGLSSGIIFLILPCHTEAVSWITGRNDLLLTLFSILTLSILDKYLTLPRWHYLFFFIFAVAFSLLSKESAGILPLLIFIWGVFASFAGRDSSLIKRMMLPLIIAIVLVMAFFVLRQSYLHHWIGGYGSQVHLNVSPGLIISNIIISPIRCIIPPAPSALSSLNAFRNLRIIIAILYFILLVLVFIISRKHTKSLFPALMGLCVFFYLSYAPSINLFLAFYSSYGERYLYFPSFFLSCALVTLGYLFLQRIIVRNTAFVLLIGFCIWGFHFTNHSWFIAGRLSDKLLKEAIDLNKKDCLLVLNLPDNYRGAFIFHTGFPEAVSLAKHKQTKSAETHTAVGPDRSKVKLLTTHDIHSPAEKVSLTLNGSTATLGVLGTSIPLSLPSLEDNCDIAYFTSDFLKPVTMP